MSKDVILYKKQAQQLAKAVGKVQDALGEAFQALAAVGITPIGKPETPTAGDGEPTNGKKGKGKKGKKGRAQQAAAQSNGSTFAEM